MFRSLYITRGESVIMYDKVTKLTL